MLGLRTLFIALVAPVLAACSLHSIDDRDPRRLIFDDNGFKGDFVLYKKGDTSKRVCVRKAGGIGKQDDETPEYEQCDQGIQIRDDLIPLDELNTNNGALFTVVLGVYGWHYHYLRARCVPDCPSQSDLSNLRFDTVQGEIARFKKAPFEIIGDVLRLRTVDLEFATAPAFINEVYATYGTGAFKGIRPACISLAYPAIYKTRKVEPQPKKTSSGPVFPVQDWYLWIDDNKKLKWLADEIGVDGGCYLVKPGRGGEKYPRIPEGCKVSSAYGFLIRAAKQSCFDRH